MNPDLIFRMLEDAQLDSPAISADQERIADIYAELEELDSRKGELLDELMTLREMGATA